MADLTVYVTGASEEAVRATVDEWAATAEVHSWDVEEADDYPGYSVAVDLYDSDEERLRRTATDLIATLPFQACREVDMPINQQSQTDG